MCFHSFLRHSGTPQLLSHNMKIPFCYYSYKQWGDWAPNIGKRVFFIYDSPVSRTHNFHFFCAYQLKLFSQVSLYNQQQKMAKCWAKYRVEVSWHRIVSRPRKHRDKGTNCQRGIKTVLHICHVLKMKVTQKPGTELVLGCPLSMYNKALLESLLNLRIKLIFRNQLSTLINSLKFSLEKI